MDVQVLRDPDRVDGRHNPERDAAADLADAGQGKDAGQNEERRGEAPQERPASDMVAEQRYAEHEEQDSRFANSRKGKGGKATEPGVGPEKAEPCTPEPGGGAGAGRGEGRGVWLPGHAGRAKWTAGSALSVDVDARVLPGGVERVAWLARLVFPGGSAENLHLIEMVAAAHGWKVRQNQRL